MPRKKTADPRVIKLRDEQQQAEGRFWRAYRRLRLAANAMEKQRRAINRIERRIARLEVEALAPTPQ